MRNWAAAIIIIPLAFSALRAEPQKNISAYTVGMVYVKPGQFIMGSDESFSFEGPKRVEFTRGFYIDIYEVSNAEYKIFIDATGKEPPAHWNKGNYPAGAGNKPVTMVSYYEALAFAKWAGKRLPTEIEWEKAARGTSARIFPWGNEWKSGAANIRPLIGFSRLKNAGSLPEGRSPYGAMDMAGNVWEWTTVWFEPYPGSLDINPSYGMKYKVIRGGSYRSTRSMTHTFTREVFEPALSDEDIGFRCVKDY